MAEVLLITALVLALFFIFFIRPARAVQGRRRRDLNELRIGDEVLTSGGIIAIVDAVETPPHGPMILHLELDDGVVVRARTSAIDLRLRTAARSPSSWPTAILPLATPRAARHGDPKQAPPYDHRVARVGSCPGGLCVGVRTKSRCS